MKKTVYIALSTFLLFTNCKDKEAQKPTEGVYENAEKPKVSLQHTVEFTAFKTPEKVGVKGTFKEIKLNNINSKDSLHSILQGSTFQINTQSVSTGDMSRDEKLRTLFFGKLVGKDITGKFESFQNNKVQVSISMNEMSKLYDFDFVENSDSIVINGSIDYINDFKANASFNQLHNACKELHANKTWTDVAIKVVVKK